MDEGMEEGRAGALGEENPRLFYLYSAILVLAGALAWSNSFSGPFVFDDVFTVVQNPSIARLSNLGAVLNPPKDSSTLGRPLANLTFAVNYALSGLNPWGYHLFNLAIHLCAGLALFSLTRRALRSPRMAPRFGAHAATLAFLIALLWLVHPLKTAAITYLTQRIEALASLFYLLTLLCFAKAVSLAEGEEGRGDWTMLALSAVSCLLAMASKEIAASIPLLVLLYDRAFAAGSFARALKIRRGYYALLASTWVFLAFILYLGGNRDNSVIYGNLSTPSEYGLKQFGALATYLKLTFWPSPLVFDYGWVEVGGFWEVAPQALLVCGLLAATFFALRKHPAAGFCGALAFAVLAPTSSVIPIRDAVFEHRMYLPQASVIALLVCLSYLAWKRKAAGGAFPLPVVAVALVAGAALGAATFARNADYRSERAIWEDTAAKRPQNARAHANVASYFFEEGNYAAAEASYARSLALAPGNARTLFDMAGAKLKQGKHAEAASDYARVLQDEPENAKARCQLGLALITVGRPDEGLNHLAALAASGGVPPQSLVAIGDELIRRGQYAEASRYFRTLAAESVRSGNQTLRKVALSRLSELPPASR